MGRRPWVLLSLWRTKRTFCRIQGGSASAGRLGAPDIGPARPSEDESEGLGDAIRQNEGRFTLVLTTPVAFDDGWCPDPVSPVGSGTLAGCAVQLQGAAVGRYEALGG